MTSVIAEGVKSVFGLAFMHIPPPEFMDLYNNYPVYGRKDERVACADVNADVGIIDAFLTSKAVHGLFVGHDHLNNFGGNYKGIEMTYGYKSGYGLYGPAEGTPHGARIIDLTEKKVGEDVEVTFTHSIIFETGVFEQNPPAYLRHDNK